MSYKVQGPKIYPRLLPVVHPPRIVFYSETILLPRASLPLFDSIFLAIKKITKQTQLSLCYQHAHTKTNPNKPNLNNAARDGFRWWETEP